MVISFYWIVLPFTQNFLRSHNDLATIIGAHRVSITNVISELKKQGILETKYNRIIIKNKNALKKIVFEE